MPADKSKNILELEQRTVQMRALQIIEYSSKFLDLIPRPRIEGGKAYYIANITNEPETEDKRGILPNEISPSTAVQQIVKLDKVKVFRDVINEEIMSLSLDRVKEFTEGITEGMFAKFSNILDKEMVTEITNPNNHHEDAVKAAEKKELFDPTKWNDNKLNASDKIVEGLLDNIDFLLNPSDKNNKAEVLANSKNEESIIWLVKTDLYNFIRRKHLTSMAQPKYGDFTENLRGIIR